MIVDLRTYTLHPGAIGAYLKLYGVEGFPIQLRYLPECLGYFVVETGVQNRLVHLWRYDDIVDRTRRRAAMEADPTWNAYRAKAGSFFQAQENEIVQPVPFWPIKPTVQGPLGLIDYRVYTLHPGKLGEYFRLYQNEGLETQIKHLGRCLGYFHSDIGVQHRIVHLWGYEDPGDRIRRRGALQADPAWSSYLSKMAPLFMRMENAQLRPAPFWPPKQAA